MGMETFLHKKLGQPSEPLAHTLVLVHSIDFTTSNIFSRSKNYNLKWEISKN